MAETAVGFLRVPPYPGTVTYFTAEEDARARGATVGERGEIGTREYTVKR